MCISCCTLVIDEMAPPSAAFGAKLKETVMAGNCPWWLIDSCSVFNSKCENAPSGTALLFAELVTVAELVTLLDVPFELPAVSAFTGGVSVLGVGLYSAPVVSAFEPADVEPFPVELAAAPVVPAAAFA